jgi:hypothetical protein
MRKSAGKGGLKKDGHDYAFYRAGAKLVSTATFLL